MDKAGKKKVFILVEGQKTDVAVMENLFQTYPEIDAKYQIVSYCTNIYVLYQEFFRNGVIQDSLDLLQVLKGREKDPSKKPIFDDKYTDILLIFDLDPQDPLYAEDKIRLMQAYFSESSDMGKLYINYPMVESFYHMTTIPDQEYYDRTVFLSELLLKNYKKRVQQESKGHDYRKFISNREECNSVILQNIQKTLFLLGENKVISKEWVEIDFSELLNKQLDFMKSGYLYVLCTCAIYIYDYNQRLLVD